jgi:hypothetical protein
MNYEAFNDKSSSDWRVEAVDFENEGNIYIAIFSGPDAQARAEEYAQWKNQVHARRPALSTS